MSVFEFYKVSDGVAGANPLFCLFEGPRRAFDASLVLDLVACLIFFF